MERITGHSKIQKLIDFNFKYSQHPELAENIAVIAFGKETKFLHYYSNDYAALKHTIEHLECSGPSPLTAAMLLALGGLFEGSAHTAVVGDFHLAARVVIFTDGRLTDFTDEDAIEQDEDSIPKHSILRALFSIVNRIGQHHPIYCFPVGNHPDRALLATISSKSHDGQLLEIHRARWLGRRTLHYRGADIAYRVTNQTRIERGILRNVVEYYMSWQTYGDDDLDTIDEILSNKTRILARQETEREEPEDKYFKEKYTTVPTLGTRVRRGPDWTQDNQDSEGPGTIVGHGDHEGLVYIQWDSGMLSLYGYGYKGIYDVVVCEEPRYPEDGLAAVGCFVRRGLDWKWGDQDGGAGSIGTVYRAMDNATVYVRWPCGRKGNYRFGYDGKFDIDVCDPFSPAVIKTIHEQEGSKKFCSGENSFNDMKGNINVDETSKHTRNVNGEECQSLKLTLPKNKTHVCVENGPNSNELKDPVPQHTQRTDLKENDIESDFGFPNNVTPTDIDDLNCEQKVFLATKSSWSGAEKPWSHNYRMFDFPEKYPKGIVCECSDVYENNLSVTKNSIPIEKKVSLLKDSLTSFWHSECHNSNNEYSQDNIEQKTPNIFLQETDKIEIDYSGINRSWQWLDSTGAWIDYPEHVNSLINQRLLQRPYTSIVITYDNQSFRVVPHKLVQINLESKEKHTIRWKKVQ
ncbi:uncharacterized protein LOC111117584 isoform X3 [Crassostrea virginica]